MQICHLSKIALVAELHAAVKNHTWAASSLYCPSQLTRAYAQLRSEYRFGAAVGDLRGSGYFPSPPKPKLNFGLLTSPTQTLGFECRSSFGGELQELPIFATVV